MHQNDLVPSETMNVAITNVTLTASLIVAISNVAPNQLGNVAMTHASTSMAKCYNCLCISKGVGDGGKGVGSQSSEE
jgi:hypothetical protein